MLYFRCHSPPDVKGGNLILLKDEELICRTNVAKIVFIVVASCTGALIAILALCFLLKWRKSRRGRRKAGWKGDYRGDFTAVYTREEEDVTVNMSDSKALVSEKGKEFDAWAVCYHLINNARIQLQPKKINKIRFANICITIEARNTKQNYVTEY